MLYCYLQRRLNLLALLNPQFIDVVFVIVWYAVQDLFSIFKDQIMKILERADGWLKDIKGNCLHTSSIWFSPILSGNNMHTPTGHLSYSIQGHIFQIVL